MPSLLVTNDFPPKHGGIQSYLYELWRRLPANETTVLTTALPERRGLGPRATVPHRARRRHACCCRRGRCARRIDALAREVAGRRRLPRSDDPARVSSARVSKRRRTWSSPTVPRSPATAGSRCRDPLARRVLRGAAGIVAAGTYPAREAARTAGASLRGRGHPARRRRRSLPPGRRRCAQADPGPVRSRPRPAAGARGLAARTPQGFRRRHRRVPRPHRRATRDRRRRPRSRPARTPGRRPRARSWVGCPMPSCPRSTPPRTCSRCAVGNGGAGSRPRGSASCSSKRPRAVFRAVAGRSGGSHEAVVDGETGLRRRTPRCRRPPGRDPGARRRRGSPRSSGRCRAHSRDRAVLVRHASRTRLAPVAAGDLEALGLIT